MRKNLSKYIASFEYLDKSLIVLSVATGSISIAWFRTTTGAPVEIMNASCSLSFLITPGFVKKFLKTISYKKKKHNKIVILGRSKLNSIESKISEALMKLVTKTLWLFLMMKRDIERWKKALEWWKAKEMMLRKLVWLWRRQKNSY